MEQPVANIELWQKTQAFVLDVYRFTESFPIYEANGLSSRLRKTAVLAAVNIAEGLKTEEGNKQQAHFFSISHNQLDECRRHFMFAKYLGYGYSTELKEQLERLDALLRLYASAVVTL